MDICTDDIKVMMGKTTEGQWLSGNVICMQTELATSFLEQHIYLVI